MVTMLELDVYHRQAIDEQRHIAAAVAIHLLLARELNLMHDLIDRRATGDVHALKDNRIDCPKLRIFALHTHASNAVLAHQPLGRIIERRKAQLVLNLEKFEIRQRMLVKEILVVKDKDTTKILPEVLHCANIIAKRPLRLLLCELLNQMLLDI